MKNKIDNFKQLHSFLKLSHHPFERSYAYLQWCFKDIDFEGKKVLDIGGGNGIYSYYSRSKGAKSAINLEPFGAGSVQNIQKDADLIDNLFVEFKLKTIQDYQTEEKFDVIILHDSINHLNEELFTNIHTNKQNFEEYSSLLKKICDFLTHEGVLIVSDCSRNNFWGNFGLKSPFAPNIDWQLHQSPRIIKKLFKKAGYKNFKLRWSPFKRFGLFGRLLSKFGFLPSFFMQSHFNLIIKK